MICQGRGDGVVGLLRGVRIAAEAQGPVVVGELDAQGAGGVNVTDLVRTGQQVPGHIPQPGGGVDQVSSTAEGGDLRKDSVDGGLQGDVQVAEVSCRGEGPGVLEGEDLRVVLVQAGVPEGQRGVHRGLLDEGQQGHCDELTDVRGRGPEAHRGGEVAGAGHGEESRGDGLGDVAGRLAGRHVQGQLVHDALERVRWPASRCWPRRCYCSLLPRWDGWRASDPPKRACSYRRLRPGGRPGPTGWLSWPGLGSGSC